MCIAASVRPAQSYMSLVFTAADMDTIIDLSDASKALDLANIRFQLM